MPNLRYHVRTPGSGELLANGKIAGKNVLLYRLEWENRWRPSDDEFSSPEAAARHYQEAIDVLEAD